MGKSKRKSKKMKLFQTVREYIHAVGINQSDRFSGKIFKASFLYGFNSILNCAFLFHKAKTYRQYTDDIFMTSATIIISISFITVIVKMSRLFKFINRCERISEKSTSNKRTPTHTTDTQHTSVYYVIAWSIFNEVKNRFLSNSVLEYPASKIIYDETNQRIENWTRVIYFIIMKVTPVCWIMPKFAISIFMYFTTDMGRDALKLPIPMWWVLLCVVIRTSFSIQSRLIWSDFFLVLFAN